MGTVIRGSPTTVSLTNGMPAEEGGRREGSGGEERRGERGRDRRRKVGRKEGREVGKEEGRRKGMEGSYHRVCYAEQCEQDVHVPRSFHVLHYGSKRGIR